MEEFKDSKYKINIRDIKSSFIKTKIFSFLSKKQLLTIIKFNKELQQIFSIDIEDLKKISGKYKVGEKNGKGKEYIINTKTLIFEGEYLKGIKNGKGKEYYYENGDLIFEGEYLNGKRNGKGKEYYLDGKLKFEGEYLFGKRNGKGKEYNINGKLEFEGEYLNGERNGKGKEYNINGKLIFEGKYLNGNKSLEDPLKVIYNTNGRVLPLPPPPQPPKSFLENILENNI